jgi:hypothetical protein
MLAHQPRHRFKVGKDAAIMVYHVQATDTALERKKNYCALAVALVEDLPMGARLSLRHVPNS